METLHLLALWLANGLLAAAFLLWENSALVVLLPAAGWLALPAPREQQPWVWGAIGLATLAAGLVPAPVPGLLAVMMLAGAGAVQLEQFNPATLRWRTVSGLALYAVAALGFAAYGAYAGQMDTQAWANLLAPDEGLAALSQGRAYLVTLATLGLWVVLPLGYFGLLGQALLAHPPLLGKPAELIHVVRARPASAGLAEEDD